MTINRFGLAVMLTCAFALTVAGCGNHDSGDATASAPPVAGPPAPPSDATTPPPSANGTPIPGVDNTAVPSTTTIDGKKVTLEKTTSGLRYYDIKPGTGATPKAGQAVTVQYIGTLLDGSKFDSSYDHGQPFSFPLGQGQVIPGWDEGVATMKVGGKRRLVVPGDLAYGANSPTPAIPPNATLVFDIELLEAK